MVQLAAAPSVFTIMTASCGQTNFEQHSILEALHSRRAWACTNAGSGIPGLWRPFDFPVRGHMGHRQNTGPVLNPACIVGIFVCVYPRACGVRENRTAKVLSGALTPLISFRPVQHAAHRH